VTDLSWIFVAAGAVFAGIDWYAVVARNKPLEYVFKPATMVAFIGAAVALTPHSDARRWAFVAALALSLGGDVFLMLNRFVPGLLFFFVAHVAYIVGLRISQTGVAPLLASALIVLTVAGLLGRRILTGVRVLEPELSTPVSAYIAVISVMTASALASGVPFAATAAVLFMASDTLIAWNRFVRPLDRGPITIIVTYHLAQAGFVLALAL
jgi:uncharacterized membrane protein YhhN